MVVATMNDKVSQKQTLLIDKEDFDKMKMDLEAARVELKNARDEIVALNVKARMIKADLIITQARLEVYEGNILCRGIAWLTLRAKYLSAYLRKRFDAWVEREWGSDY